MSIRIYWIDCRNVDWMRVRHLMSAERLRKIDAIRDAAGKRRSAAAELALVLAMARERKCEPQVVRWRTLPGGKPVSDDGWHFSLSHSGDIAVCAVSERAVGVDVEAQRTISTGMRRKILHESETDTPDSRLLWKWVAKESYLKLTGEGLSRPMNGFSAEEGAIRDGDGNAVACVRSVEFSREDSLMCVCAAENAAWELIELKW